MAYAITLAGFRIVATTRIRNSVFIAARIGEGAPPGVSPWMIRLGHETMLLRHRLIGQPMAALRGLAKRVLGRG
jgi:hypothetical protein